MAPERRKLVLAVVVVLALVVAYLMWPRTAAIQSSTSNPRGRGRSTAEQTQVTAPDVHLDALDADRPTPAELDRNVFRFKPKPQPPRPQAPLSPFPGPPAQPVPSRPGPPPPPSVPPITLKFVAVIEGENHEKIASLNDGRGVALGKEGQIVLGRYKIWHIGEESIEVSYLDGTGRTTIRLTGQ